MGPAHVDGKKIDRWRWYVTVTRRFSSAEFPWAVAAQTNIRPFASFSFLYLKNQNFKNICPFRKISKIYPGRPPKGRQDLFVIFFFQFANRSLAGGMRVQGGLSPHPRAAGGAPPTGDGAGGGLSPPSGDRVCPIYISH